jgi:hypothetical protein
MIVVGGWQARWYDLFLKYKPEILQLFAFDEAVKVHVDDVMHQIPAETLRLGVHIRRGDYRTWQGGKYYYTDDQYLSVIRQFLRAGIEPYGFALVVICYYHACECRHGLFERQ